MRREECSVATLDLRENRSLYITWSGGEGVSDERVQSRVYGQRYVI